MGVRYRPPRGKRFTAPVVSRRIAVLGVLAVVSLLVSLSLGRYPVPPGEVADILTGTLLGRAGDWSTAAGAMVLNVRLPRVLVAMLVGAALSAAGAVYQGIFRNPMVSPDVLGSSAGAGFGAALGLFLSVGYLGVSLLAFGCGLAAVLLAVYISQRGGGRKGTLNMVLAGILIGSLFSSATSFIKLIADTDDQLPAITYWLMGSLAATRTGDLLFLLLPMAVGLVPLLLLSWRINVLTMSPEEAAALGVPVEKLRLVVVLCATLVTAASVAVSGVIGWVGLVVPHLARRLVGCDYRLLLPTSMLLGGCYLLWVDNLARTVATTEIPIGILTAFLGTPFFLHLILKNNR